MLKPSAPLLTLAILLWTLPEMSAQDAGRSSLESVQSEVEQLRQAVATLENELRAARAETGKLQNDVASLEKQLQQTQAAQAAGPQGSAQTQIPESERSLAEEQRMLAAKVEEQRQTKVESGSRYRVRLSGMVLFNAYSNRGWLDNADLPETAEPAAKGLSGGDTGASARQSLVGIDVSGPEWKGARTSGEVRFDFFGGFPASADGLTAGLVRMRTAKVSLDWKNTSLTAGQGELFFSPLSPTSLLSTAYPAFSSAGNMWTWTPEIYAEKRIGLTGGSRLVLQGGVLDALTGELPVNEYDRVPTAGERSREPALAYRMAWQTRGEERASHLGIASYYSRQDWNSGRKVDAWAAMTDWEVALGKQFTWSGEAYRGRAIGGLGASATGSVVFAGGALARDGAVIPVNSIGGWSQLKFQPSQTLQFNIAFGGDGARGKRLAGLSAAQGTVRENLSGMANVLFQPRSALLFSLEYRRLWTYRFAQPIAVADHIGLGAGILF